MGISSDSPGEPGRRQPSVLSLGILQVDVMGFTQSLPIPLSYQKPLLADDFRPRPMSLKVISSFNN